MINFFKNLFSTKVARAERLDNTLRGYELLDPQFVKGSIKLKDTSTSKAETVFAIYKLFPFIRYFNLIIIDSSISNNIYCRYAEAEVLNLAIKLNELGVLSEFIKINSYRTRILKDIYHDDEIVKLMLYKVDEILKTLSQLKEAIAYSLVKG